MRAATIVLCLAFAACSLQRTPVFTVTDAGTRELDAPGPMSDAPLPPTLDAPLPPVPDAGPDAPLATLDAPVPADVPVPPLDTPPPRPDAPDAGCVPRCTGDILGGCERPDVDCALVGNVCRPGAGGVPMCIPPPCVGDEPVCSADGRSSFVCRGGVRTRLFCDGYGCDGATGLCDATCTIMGEYVPGTSRFDLCAYGADFENATATGMCNTAADAEDRMARVVVTRRSRLDAVVRDDDPSVDVDTVLYLWRVCDDAAMQIACDDDVPCTEAPSSLGPCVGGVQYRQSHITADLEPGTYYLVADAIDASASGITWVCGFVSLTLTVTPL